MCTEGWMHDKATGKTVTIEPSWCLHLYSLRKFFQLLCRFGNLSVGGKKCIEIVLHSEWMRKWLSEWISKASNTRQFGVPWWPGRLRTWCCCCCGSGYCGGAGSIPDPGTSACCGCSQKKKTRQFAEMLSLHAPLRIPKRAYCFSFFFFFFFPFLGPLPEAYGGS